LHRVIRTSFTLARTEIDSRGAAALWFRVEIRLKSNNPEQKHAKVKKRWK